MIKPKKAITCTQDPGKQPRFGPGAQDLEDQPGWVPRYAGTQDPEDRPGEVPLGTGLGTGTRAVPEINAILILHHFLRSSVLGTGTQTVPEQYPR